MRRITLVILCFTVTYSVTHAQVLNDSCHQAIEIFCGDEISVDFGGHRTDEVIELEGCYPVDDENVWYKITGTGNIVYLSLCNYSSRITMAVGSCDSLVCFDDYVDHYRFECEDYSDEIAFKSDLGKEYYIICKTINPHLDATLTVTCVEPADNNFCENAVPIEIDSIVTINHFAAYQNNFEGCGGISYYPDTWYSFVGTGDTLKIDHPIGQHSFGLVAYVGDCSGSRCVEQFFLGGRNAFWAQKDSLYYIQISQNSPRDFNFTLVPTTTVENDNCEQAVSISSGDKIAISFEEVLLKNSLTCYYENTTSYGRWYEFVGNDSVLQIDYTNSNNYAVRIMSGDCNELFCETITRSGISNPYSLFTEKGKKYYIVIYHSGIYISNPSRVYQIQFISYPIESNNQYNDAIPTSCGVTNLGTFSGATQNLSTNSSTSPSLWYKTIGTGDFYRATTFFLMIIMDRHMYRFTEKIKKISCILLRVVLIHIFFLRKIFYIILMCIIIGEILLV